MRTTFWIVFIIVIIGAGYWLWYSAQHSGGEEDNTELANLASTYCIERGGSLEMHDSAAGVQGFCVFPDGTACEEWAFYRGEDCQDKVRQPANEDEDSDLINDAGTASHILDDPLSFLPF